MTKKRTPTDIFDADEGVEESGEEHDKVATESTPEFPEFIARLSDSDKVKKEIWSRLETMGYTTAAKLVINLGPQLSPTLRGLYVDSGGTGDGYELLEAVQREYLNGLAAGQTPRY